MSDLHEPFSGDPIPKARPVVGGIPFARPVASPLVDDEHGAATLVGDEPSHRDDWSGKASGFDGLQPADEMLLPTSTARAALVDAAALIGLIALFELAVGGLIGLIVGVPTDSLHPRADPVMAELNRVLLIPTLSLRAVGAVIIGAGILRYRRQPVGSVGIGRGGFALNLLIGLGTTVVLYGLVLLVMLLLWFVFPGLLERMEENAERIMAVVPNLHPLGFIVVALGVGLYEELVFRGFLMTRLRRATGSWTFAVLISTVIFTALHAHDQVAAALIAVTILSLVFSVVTIWRRSIIPAVVAHTLWNLSQFLYLQSIAGDSWT